MKPITPLTTTLPTMAKGTLRAAWGNSSARWHAASYLVNVGQCCPGRSQENGYLPKERVHCALHTDEPGDAVALPTATVHEFGEDKGGSILRRHDSKRDDDCDKGSNMENS